MAAITPSQVYRTHLGTFNLYIARFDSFPDPEDTWSSGIGGIVTYWVSPADPAQVTNNVFTFSLSTETSAINLFVLARG
jgi:hypothetical protein